jgi:hypothetical protein
MGTPVIYGSGDYGDGSYARFIGYGAASYGKAFYGVWTERTDVEVDIVATASASVRVEGAERIIEAEFGLPYGNGEYGLEAYGKAILSSASATCDAVVVRDAPNTAVSASAAFSADSEKIYQGEATSSASSSNTATAEQIFQSGAIVSASLSGSASGLYVVNVAISVTAGNSTFASNYVRIRPITNVAISTTSAFLSAGREKWEGISNDANTWDTIAETSATWTEVVNDTNIWTNAA